VPQDWIVQKEDEFLGKNLPATVKNTRDGRMDYVRMDPKKREDKRYKIIKYCITVMINKQRQIENTKAME